MLIIFMKQFPNMPITQFNSSTVLMIETSCWYVVCKSKMSRRIYGSFLKHLIFNVYVKVIKAEEMSCSFSHKCQSIVIFSWLWALTLSKNTNVRLKIVHAPCKHHFFDIHYTNHRCMILEKQQLFFQKWRSARIFFTQGFLRRRNTK